MGIGDWAPTAERSPAGGEVPVSGRRSGQTGTERLLSQDRF